MNANALLLGLPLLLGAPLAAGDEELLRLLESFDQPHAPGVGVAMLVDGEVELMEVFGLADVASGRELTAQTPTYIASVAKIFTAACVSLAEADGDVDLDEPITERLPELPESFARVTLAHLLQHRSGIVDVYDASIALDLGDRHVTSNGAVLELLARSPELAFAPGREYRYCNSGYVLLAEALGAATGLDLARFAEERLFEPLGMSSSGYLASGAEHPPELGRSYGRGDGDWQAFTIQSGMRGPGGMLSSLADLVSFEAAWASGRFADRETRRRMLQAPAGPPHPAHGRYGSGWMLQELGGLPVVRHAGGAFGYSADILRFPEQGTSFIAISLEGGRSAWNLTEAMAEVVLAEEMAAAGAPPPVGVSHAVSLGAWVHPETEALFLAVPGGNGLRLAGLGDFVLELVATSGTHFVSTGAQGSWTLDIDHDEARLEVDGAFAQRLERLPPPTEDVAASCAGHYSTASGATIELRARGAKLELVQHAPLLRLSAFQPIAADRFACNEGAFLTFERDAQGDVVGVRIDANRATGLQLTRR